MNRSCALMIAGLALAAASCGSSTSAGSASGDTSPARSPAAAGATAATAATASAEPAAPTTSGSASPRPVACSGVTSQGSLSQTASSQVSLAQIGQAVGFTVTTAMPDTQSALGAFRGYENCRYQFDTPAGGAQEDITLVVGTNPLDGKDAATEFTTTKSTREPISDRSCTGNGCGYTFSPLAGVGDAALVGKQSDGTEVVVVQTGRVYLEIGPGNLKEERMVNLAKLVVGAVK